MPLARHLFRCLGLLAVIFTGSGCSSPEQTAHVAPRLDNRAWWKGDGVPGKPRIVINLSEQRVRYFKGNELVGMSPISSGREGNGTLNGKFHIMEKDIDHRSSLYGSYVNEAGEMVVGDVDSRTDPRPPGTKFLGANMRYFMRIVGGIGMHEGYLPGYPASHGCIRLPTKMAAIFFRETPPGTPVEIVGAGHLASAEDAIPLGHGDPESIPTGPDTGLVAESNPKLRSETIRRALVEVSTPSTRYRPEKRRWRKLKPGETLYLELE